MVSNLEYRLNFIADAILQPCLSSAVEVVLWISIFAGSGLQQIAGFDVNHYIAYALWAMFLGRISSSWMYEFRMTNEIDTGSVNSLIVRPMSFYEYYLSQLMGYKFITTVVSLLIPAFIFLTFNLPVNWARLPLSLVLVFYYLILVHSMSFVVACLAFFLNRASSFTAAKNLCLWLLSGELFPLDLLPEPYKTWLIRLPFSSGVYIPTGYITGRVDFDLVLQSFFSVTLGILFFSLIGAWMWRKGLNAYSGTGA